jgi:hypothetical protein
MSYIEVCFRVLINLLTNLDGQSSKNQSLDPKDRRQEYHSKGVKLLQAAGSSRAA